MNLALQVWEKPFPVLTYGYQHFFMQGLQTGFRNVYKVGRTMKKHVKSFHPDSSLEGVVHVDHSLSSWLCLSEPFSQMSGSQPSYTEEFGLCPGEVWEERIYFLHTPTGFLFLVTKDNTAEKSMLTKQKFLKSCYEIGLSQILLSCIYTVGIALSPRTRPFSPILAIKGWKLYPTCRRTLGRPSHLLLLAPMSLSREIIHLLCPLKLK